MTGSVKHLFDINIWQHIMRVTVRLLMASAQSSALRPSMNLLPPIPLYRRLLRAHRKHLPAEMRLLGDEYVKAEFRAHKNVENPVHLVGFLTEWQLYAQKIEGDAWVGDKLDSAKIQKMSDEQLVQLYELMKTIQQRGEEADES